MTREITEPKTLYVFIDESGNFDFTPKGSKHFILTGFTTFDPVVQREQLVKMRYQLLREGYDHEYFHASEDKQHVRDEVFRFLGSLGNSFEVHTVWAQKNKAHSSLYKESYLKKDKIITRVTGMGLYQKLCECLLQYLFRGRSGQVDRIVIVIGSLFTGDKKKIFMRTLKHYLKTNFTGVAFDIYSHPVCSDLNCQLADYCCWAISAKLERDERRPLSVIRPNLKSAFDYFKTGTTEYYEYKTEKQSE